VPTPDSAISSKDPAVAGGVCKEGDVLLKEALCPPVQQASAAPGIVRPLARLQTIEIADFGFCASMRRMTTEQSTSPNLRGTALLSALKGLRAWSCFSAVRQAGLTGQTDQDAGSVWLPNFLGSRLPRHRGLTAVR